MDLSSLPAWADILLFISVACGAAIAVYAVSRALFSAKAKEETQTLAGSVIFRISALHSLILALVFAQEQISYSNLRSAIVTEADAIADVYNDLARYDSEATAPVRAVIVDYVREAAGPEWDELAQEGRLTARPWQLWEEVYEHVLDLEPQTRRQESLRDNMLSDIDTISDTRTERGLAAIGAVSDLFWVAAVVGIFLIIVPYFTFAPTVLHVLLLAIFAAYNGLVLFFIAALSNPYAPPAALEPLPFTRLLEVWS